MSEEENLQQDGLVQPQSVPQDGLVQHIDQSTDCSNYALTDCYHLIVIVNFKLLCSNLPHPAYQAKSREDESHEDNHGDYHADRHLLRGRGSICMIHDKSVVIIYDKKEFSIERMFRPSLVFQVHYEQAGERCHLIIKHICNCGKLLSRFGCMNKNWTWLMSQLQLSNCSIHWQ